MYWLFNFKVFKDFIQNHNNYGNFWFIHMHVYGGGLVCIANAANCQFLNKKVVRSVLNLQHYKYGKIKLTY